MGCIHCFRSLFSLRRRYSFSCSDVRPAGGRVYSMASSLVQTAVAYGIIGLFWIAGTAWAAGVSGAADGAVH